MKRLRTLFAGTALATSLAMAGPVSADLPVIDVSSLKQSILTAAHTLQEVNNQITQIQQFVQMLENEARNLLSLPFLGTAADHRRHRPGEQPDETGAEPRL
jgi:type IV secretion system protein TrbJ